MLPEGVEVKDSVYWITSGEGGGQRFCVLESYLRGWRLKVLCTGVLPEGVEVKGSVYWSST